MQLPWLIRVQQDAAKHFQRLTGVSPRMMVTFRTERGRAQRNLCNYIAMNAAAPTARGN